MFFIMVTLDVLKLDKSKYFNAEHEENIEFIVVTLNVLKLDKFKEINEEQQENINCMSLTLDVLKLDKSISIIFSQWKNIYLVDVRRLSHISVILLILFSESLKLYVLFISFLV